jgi:hypothetical protein
MALVWPLPMVIEKIKMYKVLATPRPSLVRWGFLQINRTAAGVTVAAKHGINNCSGTTDAGLNRESLGRAVTAAGTALHAGITIFDFGTSNSIQTQNGVGAYLNTHTTGDAFYLIQLQGNHIFKIF